MVQNKKAASKNSQSPHLLEIWPSIFCDAPWSVCSVFNDPDDCYWAWSHIFIDICQVHAPYREVETRSVSEPWITPQIRKVVTFDLDKANILNEPFLNYWRKTGQRIAKIQFNQSNVHVSIVAACVISINLSSGGIVWLSWESIKPQDPTVLPQNL